MNFTFILCTLQDVNKISHFEVKMNIYLNEMKQSKSSEVVTLSENSLTHHEIKLHPDFRNKKIECFNETS